MAGVKISALPSVASALLTDFFPVVQGGVTSQETLSQVATLFGFASAILGVTFGGTGVSNPTAHGVAVGEGSSPMSFLTLTNGQLLIGSTGVDPVPAVLTAGANISISNSAGGITIAAVGAASFAWNQITTSQTMVINSGYITNSGSLITLTLPTTSAVGTELAIVGQGAGGWSIAQATGQQVHIGSTASTSGAGGSVSSTNQFDSLYLVCITANTVWSLVGAPQGNLTVV